ncbi:MAG: SPASM domain-containing protein [Spirochaetota bacterium]|nr:SPASM domain-containing protein [Spirochaetota bacterium]
MINKNNIINDVVLLDLNRMLFGDKFIKALHIKRTFRDFSSYLYLLKHFQLKSLYNFIFTKLYVPTGEGFHLGLHRKLIKYPDKIPIPRNIEMETTTVCNKKCIICEYIYWSKDAQVKRHLKLDEFKHIINQFPVIRWANLTGEGSSFLNKDYPLMVKYLWEKHKSSIWLVDHLDDISIEKLQKEVFPYIHGIYISMDAATKETYESIKIGCNYDNVINNLKSIIQYKKRNNTPFPHLSFRYIIINKNVHELPLFLDLINSIASQTEWGGSSTMVEFTGLLNFKEINKYYIEKIPQSIVDELMKRRDGIEFQFSHAEEPSNPPIEQCIAWLEPYIMMPGYVLPCCAVMMSNNRPHLRKYSFGNVLNDNFINIWENEYYLKFRSMVNDPDKPVPTLCVGCRAFRTKHRIAKNGIWDVHKDK